MGPACENEETLSELILEGVDIIRLNFSHGSHEVHANNLHMVRSINERLGTNVAILQDLQGPKIRVGKLETPIDIKKGDLVIFRTDIDQQTPEFVPVQYATFAQDVRVGDLILLDDGKIEMRVLETDRDTTVKCRVEFGEQIKSRKGINLPQTHISMPTISEKDYQDIEFAIKHNVEWLALSFVRSADDIRLLRELIRLKNGVSKIIAKIEKPEAVEDIDQIIAASDAIMVARGDLGVEVPMEEVPTIQKRIIRLCNKAAKPVIVATQVMESMIESPSPTRAEASDVANAVEDGADAVMLSGETSVGKYPVKVISSINRILRSVERESNSVYYRNMGYNAGPASRPDQALLSGAIITTACQLAQQTRAKALVGMTRSGYTAYQLSHCRPESHIYIFTGNRSLLTTLNLVWGVRAFYYDKEGGTDDVIHDLHRILRENGLISPGDVVINTSSMPRYKSGLTNMIKISLIES